MRFRAEQHLRRQTDIRAVREQGRRIDCRAFTMWWRKRELDPKSGVPAACPSRVCVIASTKAVGAAVQRNRAKRRLREVFRHRQHEVPAGIDFLLIARQVAAVWPLPHLESRFAEACRQIAADPFAEYK
jgi:ribonuclease P protein component